MPRMEPSQTYSLRELAGGTDLAARVLLDFDQKLFRRDYRRPVLVSAALAADADDLARWLTAGAARLLGRDVAARVLNRLASEAAEPLFVHAVISGGSPVTEQELRSGVRDACAEADATCLSEDETHTWDRKVTIALAATGVVERARMMDRRRLETGDVVLAVGSDRLWPPLAGGVREISGSDDGRLALVKAGLDGAAALVQPAPVLARRVQSVLRRYRVKRVIRSMAPVEGDGLAAALARLVGDEFDVKRVRGARCFSDLLAALAKAGLAADEAHPADEGHLRGIGFLMAVSEPFAASIARRMRRLGAPTYVFGRLAARKPA